MKNFLLSGLLILLNLVAQAQGVDVAADTSNTNRPRAGRTRVSAIGNRLFLKGSTGNAVPQPTLAEVQQKVTFLSVASIRTQTLTVAAPINLTDIYKVGVFIADLTDTTTPDNGGTVLVATNGVRYKRQYTGGLNICWFGAIPNDAVADDAAFAATIAAAKADAASYLFKTVIAPDGRYIITTTMNATDTYGLCIKGTGNRVGATEIVCNTNGIGIDFSGSTKSGLLDINLTVSNGLSTPSTIAVQFALSKDAPNQATAGVQKGGLNCYMNNVNIAMGDFPTMNAGLGAIPLVNCRSEEFSAFNVDLQGNTGAVFTNDRNLLPVAGISLTIASPYTPLQDDTNGSMGVISFTGQESIHCFGRETPAMVLNGVNGLDYHGYIGRIGGNPRNGTYQTALRLTNYCSGLKLSGTIESYGQILSCQNTLENAVINFSTANHADATVPSLAFGQFAAANGLDVRVWFGNPGERANRMFIYTAPVNGGDSPTSATIRNSTFTCTGWEDNTRFIPGNLLRNTSNSRFNTSQPFEKKGAAVIDCKSYVKGLGLVQSGNAPVTGSLIHFTRADRTTTSSGNAGYYSAFVKGVVRLGSSATANGPAVVAFEGWVTVNVDGANASSNLVGNNSQVLITTRNIWNAGYLNLTNLALSMDFSGTNPSVNLTVSTGGTGVGEGIEWNGTVELTSNFAVNQSVIFD